MPALGIISLLASCILISSKKYFWNDELFSYYFLSESSLSKMLTAFHDKINNTPVLYFFLGWFWDKLFGSTELSLRIFSSLGMCFSLLIVWITLRSTYNFISTAIGTLSVFLTSEIIINQNAEARMYGLFLTVCALGFFFYDKINRSKGSRWILLFFNFCVHVAIIHTHLFGAFYSGTVLISFLLTDRLFNLHRPRVYMSILLSWLSIILYIPTFLIQADAGNPRTWIPVPTLKDLVDYYIFSSTLISKLFVAFLLILISSLPFSKSSLNSGSLDIKRNKTRKYIDTKIPFLVFGILFVSVPTFVWIFSRTIKPVFWDRYMTPSLIGSTILLTHIISKLNFISFFSEEWRRLKFKKANLRVSFFHMRLFLFLSLMTFVILLPIAKAIRYPKQNLPDLNFSPSQFPNLPIVIQKSSLFLEYQHYSPNRKNYFFILDWEAAVSIKSGVWGPQEYKHLDALKRNYAQLSSNVLSSKAFLGKFDRFLVLEDIDYGRSCPLVPIGLEMAHSWKYIHCPQWAIMRLHNNKDYKLSFYIKNHFSYLLLVEKIKH